MPQLVSDDPCIELCILPSEPQVVGVQIQDLARRGWPDGIDAPEASLLVGLVIEDSLVGFRRLADESVDAPRSVPPNPPHGIEALSHVRAFSNRDDSLGAIRELLAARAKREAVLWIRRKAQVHEPLRAI